MTETDGAWAEYENVHGRVHLFIVGSPSGLTWNSLIAQAILEFEAVLLSRSLECWDYRYKPPQLAFLENSLERQNKSLRH